MKPLQAIGLGVLVLALTAKVGGYDIYADPVGWLLILAGMAGFGQLEPPLPRRSLLLNLALVGLVVSAVIWLPDVDAWLRDAEPALAWAANLPKFGFLALLCHCLAEAAEASADAKTDLKGRVAALWLRTAETVLVFVMVAPILVLGAGWSSLSTAAGTAAALVLLMVMLLAFVYAYRPWAIGPEPQAGVPSSDS